jgi:IS5 family transposase
MYVPQDYQKTFCDNAFMSPDFLDPEHELFKIANLIDWDSLGNQSQQFYSTSKGRDTLPMRLMIGLHLAKHLYGLSDRDCLLELKSNLYLQYLCDVPASEVQEAFHPSLLSKFRSKIGEKGAVIVEKEIFSILKKHKLLKGKTAVFDTTVVDSPIDYPTDIKLLERCRKACLDFINQAKAFGINFQFRTYARTARKVFLTYQHLRKHTKKGRRKVQKKLLQFLRRNIEQLKKVISQLQCSLDEEAEALRILAEKKLQTIQAIFEQQKKIYHGQSIQHRIVSLWATHIRPMVRGKFPVAVEFGPKILLELKGRFLFFSKLFFDNKSDSTMVEETIKSYQARHGHIPTAVGYDRGFWSPENEDYLKEQGVQHIGLQTRRKRKPDDFDSAAQRRLRRRRCAIEAKISLGKRRYWLRRLNYRIRDGETIWIRLSLATMNLHQAVKFCLN